MSDERGERARGKGVGEGLQFTTGVFLSSHGGCEKVNRAGPIAGKISFFLETLEKALHGPVLRLLGIRVNLLADFTSSEVAVFPEKVQDSEFCFGDHIRVLMQWLRLSVVTLRLVVVISIKSVIFWFKLNKFRLSQVLTQGTIEQSKSLSGESKNPF